MIYESVCLTCGTHHTYVRRAADYLDTPVCCGQKTEKRIFTAPSARMDMAPWDAFESPATGRMITSYAQRREDMKTSGCRDWDGLESEKRYAADQKRQNDQTMDAKLDHAARTALAQLAPDKRALLAA